MSFHLRKKYELDEKVVEYFKKNQPIGCRDKQTQKKLKKRGIKTYFSGCATLTIKEKYSDDKRKGIVFIIDNIPGNNLILDYEKAKK
ncbi:MAG: polysaccharide pyruvyl transferase family protein [Pikeienuella sp.]